MEMYMGNEEGGCCGCCSGDENGLVLGVVLIHLSSIVLQGEVSALCMAAAPTSISLSVSCSFSLLSLVPSLPCSWINARNLSK